MAVRDLTHRRLEPEAMDDPSVDPELHRDALAKLAQFNYLAGCAGTIGRELVKLCETGEQPLRVLDIATGGGDLVRRLVQQSQGKGWSWSIDGADLSRNAIEHAQESCAHLPMQIRPTFFVLDALRNPLPEGYDVLTCSLFLHHLSESDAVALLSNMRKAAKRAVIVQDLLRSPASLRLTWLATRLFSRNALIHEDGMRSVEAAFTIEEARELARRAGFEHARVVNRWPYRWVLSE